MAIIPDFTQLNPDQLQDDDWLTGWDLSEGEMFKISVLDFKRNLTIWNEISGSGTVTLSNTNWQQLIKGSVTQINLPASPGDGQKYVFKNITGSSVTLSGNGNNIYTSSSNATRSIMNGTTYTVIYSDSDSLWYAV